MFISLFSHKKILVHTLNRYDIAMYSCVWGKQPGLPDGPVWGHNTETVYKAGVKVSGGVFLTWLLLYAQDSPQNAHRSATLGCGCGRLSSDIDERCDSTSSASEVFFVLFCFVSIFILYAPLFWY